MRAFTWGLLCALCLPTVATAGRPVHVAASHCPTMQDVVGYYQTRGAYLVYRLEAAHVSLLHDTLQRVEAGDSGLVAVRPSLSTVQISIFRADCEVDRYTVPAGWVERLMRASQT